MTESVATERSTSTEPPSGLPGGAAPEPVRPLDYGRGDDAARPARGAWASFVVGFWDRVHGVAEFVGMLMGMGLLGRLGMGLALACILGGAGRILAERMRYDTYSPISYTAPGWGWMALGGFLLGLSLPRRDTKD